MESLMQSEEDPRMAQVRAYMEKYSQERKHGICKSKVLAVKLYREIRGCGLQVAMRACEAMVIESFIEPPPRKNMKTLEGRFIYYTETQLATLEVLKSRKRSSQSEIARQRDICNGMMETVKRIAHEVDIAACPRVSEWLQSSIMPL